MKWSWMAAAIRVACHIVRRYRLPKSCRPSASRQDEGDQADFRRHVRAASDRGRRLVTMRTPTARYVREAAAE